ncbi:MAG: molybdenum ABC transporter ATP-binding protein [Methylotenera sp.]|nr:molybdenum ABC transporter ATP-binding protein [Methylotenera sp.]
MTGIQARFKIDWAKFKLDVDLHLPNQGITAIFGHSGSGKTTLLRCIAGLERSQTGHLTVSGEIWQSEQHWRPTHKRGLGYVFQEASLFAHLTVMGNLLYGRQRISGHEKISLEQAVELLGIAHLLDRKPEKLSGGERSRVSIARALAANPSILLLDEPLAALDYPRKQEIIPYLERLHGELHIPVLYVSHAADEVARLADHLVVMDNGRALSSGPLTEMLTRPDLPIRLGQDAGAVFEAIVAEIDDTWHMARVEFTGGSLWVGNQRLSIGSKIRVQVLAKDVSLATALPSKTSIQNILQGQVGSIANDEHPSLALVRVQIGNTMLLSRITKKALASLNVTIHQKIWVQIKSVALMEG